MQTTKPWCYAQYVSKLFQKKEEDFACEHCGEHVIGNGYTNHCPECLWSKHVDIHPGDRASTCGGLMKPTAITQEGPQFIIDHTCRTCSYIKRNKLAQNDNMETVVAIMRELANR